MSSEPVSASDPAEMIRRAIQPTLDPTHPVWVIDCDAAHAALSDLLVERQQLLKIATEYVEHGSWRCTYRTRYGRCMCGLDERLAAVGLPPLDPHDPEAS